MAKSTVLSVMKRCTRCGETKLRGLFYTRVDGSHRGPCKECWKAEQRTPAARRKNAASKRRSSLKANYGLTEAEYADLYARQAGRCAVCQRREITARPDTGTVMTLSVDHDHSTGVVRGLLCQRCNRAIGLLGDDPVLLEAAKAYLEKER